MSKAREQTLLGMPVREVTALPHDSFAMVTQTEVVLYSAGVIHKLTPSEYAAHVERCWRQTMKETFNE